MRSRRRNWMLRRIALAFAVAAVAAPMAQAHPLEPGATKAEFTPSENIIPRGNTAPHGSTIEQRYGAANRGDRIELARLNDRGTGADLRGLDGVENVRAVPDSNVRATDGVELVRLEPRGVGDAVLTSSRPSFDWGDAGIGAGLAFAAMLLATAAGLSVRQYGRLGQV